MAFLVVLLAALAAIGMRSITPALHAWHEHQRVTARVSALRAENAYLRRVAERLRGDLAVIEARAREGLGLIQPHESAFPLRGSSRDSAVLRPSVPR